MARAERIAKDWATGKTHGSWASGLVSPKASMLPNRGKPARVTRLITTASLIIDLDRLSLSGREDPSLATARCRWLESPSQAIPRRAGAS